MDEVKRWWGDVPIVTKFLFAGCGGLTIAANFGIVSPYFLYWVFEDVYKKFQIWRLITPLLFMGRLGFGFLVQMMFLYNHSSQLERNNFAGRTADYIYMILVCSLLLLVIGYFMVFYMLSHALVMVIIYVWSRMNPNGEVSFYFGLRFKAIYMPWVLVLFETLMGDNPVVSLVGIFVGHIYYYLTTIYPAIHNKPNYLTTPQWFINILPAHMRGAGFGRAPAWGGPQHQPQQPQQPRGHQWGAGRALG